MYDEPDDVYADIERVNLDDRRSMEEDWKRSLGDETDEEARDQVDLDLYLKEHEDDNYQN